MRTIEFSETEHVDDQGSSPQQLDAVKTNRNDDSAVSSIILPEPGVNVQAQVEAAINEVVTELQEVETEEAQPRPVTSWPSTDTTPASEFTTPS